MIPQAALKYWREIAIVLLIGGGVFMYTILNRTKSSLVLSETNLNNARVEMETFKSGVVQANNTWVAKTQAELKDQLEKEFKAEVERQNQKILALVKSQIKAEFDEVFAPGPPGEDNIFRYNDQLMSHISVDTNDPNKPLWSYQIAPFTINLTGTLNFSENDGTMRWWTKPEAKGLPKGMHVTIPELTLVPSKEMNQWTAAMKGKEVYIPTMPRYTIGGLFGREWLKEIPGGYRNVFGADATYNWPNGWGVGGGFIGSTVFVRGAYSFGK